MQNLEEFVADLRTTWIKARYLRRRYQFLKSFVQWLEDCYFELEEEYAEISSSAAFQINDPAAKEVTNESQAIYASLILGSYS